jgi:hypothetical protein
MRGRAGRKGKDEIGETYLCCRKNDIEEVTQLMHAELPQVSSGLITDKRRIQQYVLAKVECFAVLTPISQSYPRDYCHQAGHDQRIPWRVLSPVFSRLHDKSE